MGGNYRNNNKGGGGRKDFKVDPIKQFLISRGTARDRAVDLCCAGKIELKDIPEMTDKLTILHFGQISVDPQVDKEIMRIAARCQERAKQKQETQYGKPDGDKPEGDKPVVLCDNCTWGPNGTDECADGNDNFPYNFTTCDNYGEGKAEEGGDMEALAASERQREYEEQQRQAAEDDASEAKELKDRPSTVDGKTTYTCGTCQKVYKTVKGLERHEKAVHEVN